MVGKIKCGSVLVSTLLSGVAFAPFANATQGPMATVLATDTYIASGETADYKTGLPTQILNVALVQGGEVAEAGKVVDFLTYWNYDRAVKFASIRIFEASDLYLSNPVATLPFTREQGARWRVPENGSGDYKYVLRVYSEAGLFDETKPRRLKAVSTPVSNMLAASTRASIKQHDHTAIRNISVKPIVRTKRAERPDIPRTEPVQAVVRPVPAAQPELQPTVLPATRILVDQAYQDEAIGAAKAERASNEVLRQGGIQVRFDGLDVQPLLNIGLASGQAAVMAGSTVEFATYWNYDHWVDRAEIEIYDPNDTLIAAPIAILPVDPMTGRAAWTVPAFRQTSQYTYVLKVFDKSGHFDETVRKHLALVKTVEPLERAPGTITPIYGEDATARRNIQIKGGAVTVSGKGLGAQMSDDLKVMGRPVPMGPEGDFAIQKILPVGEHDIEVRYTRSDGTRIKTTKTASIPESEVFFVALGDLTIGTRSSEGRALLEASGEEFEDTYVTGRGAFYLKGKIRGRYLVTASMDTTEDDIDSLFSNLSKKDPQSILRRVDPDRYYPVYGDNSTYVEDAPTQGRFYVRIEDGDNHIVWGNFFTTVRDTEFAQIDRGLYGAKAEYNSDEVTEDGERKRTATLFAADPGTIPGRQEFRATGGSIYFLENQDITLGSERLRVELRDQDSGLVLESRSLRPFVDYEIDYIQGRVMLSSPLASTQIGNQIVRDGTLSGADIYLVAQYEHTPAFTDIEGYSTGGRVEGWVGNHMRLGLTGQDQEAGDADQTLLGADLLLRKSETTYLKAELAQTEGQAFDERASLDGGFTFDPLSAGPKSDDAAIAWRLEGAFNNADFGHDRLPLRGNAYYEHLEDGFAAPGRLTRGETERYGGSLETRLGARTEAAIKYDSVSIEGTVNEETFAGDVRFAMTEKLQAGLGLRHNDLSGSRATQQGVRSDLGVELRYQAAEDFAVYGFGQGTLEADTGRKEANRAGLGLEARLFGAFQVKGEVSDGDGGTGALAGLTWQRADGEEYYLNYTLDADRTEPGVDGIAFLPNTENALTVGGRKRFSDTLSVYGEERAAFGDRAGLTHAYGLDFTLNDYWSFGGSFEVGEVEELDKRLEREAYTVTSGYSSDKLNFGAAFEWRSDDQDGETRETWLFRSNLGLKVSPDWTAILKYNKAESNFTGGAFFDGDFTEAQIGGAYRPTSHDRLNALVRYTYFEDLPASSQISDTGQSGLPAQKSNIFSIDGSYRLTTWLTLGGKVGVRQGEVSLSRTDEDFIESKASLAILRADMHVVKRWDALLEARILDVETANDTKSGVLAALYRHVGDHAKVGLGYNFTDFSDDLTDLSFDDSGLFLNIIAKF